MGYKYFISFLNLQLWQEHMHRIGVGLLALLYSKISGQKNPLEQVYLQKRNLVGLYGNR